MTALRFRTGLLLGITPLLGFLVSVGLSGRSVSLTAQVGGNPTVTPLGSAWDAGVPGLSCAAPDDCKVLNVQRVFDAAAQTEVIRPAFLDCNNATCSVVAETAFTVSTAPATSPTATNAPSTSGAMACPAPDRCRMVVIGLERPIPSSSTVQYFVGCNDASCTSRIVEQLPPVAALDRSFAIGCPPSGTCKIVYGTGFVPKLLLRSCNDSTCASFDETIVSLPPQFGGAGSVLHVSIDCPAANDCKILFFSYEGGGTTPGLPADIGFIDCDDAACTQRTVTVVASGMLAQQSNITYAPQIACTRSDNCAFAYHNTAENSGALTFVRCTNSTCTQRQSSTLWSGGGANLITSIHCPADDDCKVVATMESGYYFFDCNDEACTCATRTKIADLVSNTQNRTNISCPSGGTCRVELANANPMLIACSNSTCGTPIATACGAPVPSSAAGSGASSSVSLSSAGGAATICNDGIDNDQDGRTDYPRDPGCSTVVDATEANPSCTFSMTSAVVSYPIIPSSPAGAITTGPDGNVWFAMQNEKIARITPSGVITQFPIPGSPGAYVNSMTAGPDGNLWFTNEYNNVARITPSGAYTEFPVPGSSASQITAGPDGNLWFLGYHYVGKMTLSGQVTQYAVSPTSDNWGNIIAGPDGNLWFNERSGMNSRIYRITPSGVITSFSAPGALWIAAGSDGNIWYTYFQQSKIGRLSLQGAVTEFSIPTYGGALYLTGGPDGSLWYTTAGAGYVGRITTSGIATDFSGVRGAALTVGADGNLWFAGGLAPGQPNQSIIEKFPLVCMGGSSSGGASQGGASSSVNGVLVNWEGNPTCIDSDGGFVLATRGSISGGQGTGQNFDKCANDPVVASYGYPADNLHIFENVCLPYDPDGQYPVAGATYYAACPQGGTCLNGACASGPSGGGGSCPAGQQPSLQLGAVTEVRNADGGQRPIKGTLRCPAGSVVTTVAYKAPQSGDSDAVDGITIRCSPLLVGGGLGPEGALLSNPDIDVNGYTLASYACPSGSAYVAIPHKDEALAGIGQNTDDLDGLTSGCAPITSSGVGAMLPAAANPDIDSSGASGSNPLPLVMTACPQGSVLVGVDYDEMGSADPQTPDATDALWPLYCRPVLQACVGGGGSSASGGGGGLQSGLLAHWAFNDGTARDSSGNSKHGTMQNGAAISNGCMQFDGIDDHVAIPNFDRQVFTFAAWMKKEDSGLSTPPLLASANQGGLGIAFVGSRNPPTMAAPAGPGYLAVNPVGGNLGATSQTTIASGQFRHVAVTYDGMTARIYFDGALNATINAPVTYDSNGGAYALGYRAAESGHPTAAFKGLMDDVRIYDRVLGPPEIAQLSQIQPSCAGGGPAAGLVAHYTFDDGSARDSSGNGNHGAVPPGGGVTPLSGCMDFHGSDESRDFITAPDHATLDLTQTVSISYWIKQRTLRNVNVVSKNPGTTQIGNYGTGIGATPLYFTANQIQRPFFFSRANPPATAANLAVGNGVVPLQSWQHVTVTVDAAAQKVRFYRNGAFDSEQPITYPLVANNAPLTIGFGEGDEPEAQLLDAILDDVRIYDRVLGAPEIAQLSQIQPSCAGGGGGSSSSSVPACFAECGDNIVMPPEECDNGNRNSDTKPNACRTDCRAARCGDGVQDSPETCDDGNTRDGDGCPAGCGRPVQPGCGNNELDANEDCEDGNTVSGDGCSSTCTIEGEFCSLPDDGSSSAGGGTSSNASFAGGVPPVAMVQRQRCDADATNVAAAGTITISGNTYSDACTPFFTQSLNASIVEETMCFTNSAAWQQRMFCPFGHECNNGVCAPKAGWSASFPPACTDSDNGINPLVRGTAVFTGNLRGTCTNPVDYFIEDATFGGRCDDAAQATLPISAIGQNLLSPGSHADTCPTTEEFPASDVNKYVIEYYCAGGIANDPRFVHPVRIEVPCPAGTTCQNGACR